MLQFNPTPRGWVENVKQVKMGTQSVGSALAPHRLRLRLFTTTMTNPLRSEAIRRRRRCLILTIAAAKSNSEDEIEEKKKNKEWMRKMIEEIEPLDVSVIQKDVPQDSIDAMKRTISGMLGLLPSHHFQVSIDALWDPLSNLLLSSMLTGYTLRNAEYRLCVQGKYEKGKPDPPQDNKPKKSQEMGIQGGLGEMNHEAQHYLLRLQSRLSSLKKELDEIKRKNAALHMQQFVGEEKNDLLDYLRSLQPDKVAELSEPTSRELQETIYSVIHGLLATLSPKMHSKAPPPPPPHMSENTISNKEASVSSLQLQPLVCVTRDYLARLLFWCMLLGHYLRGLEYRLELMDLLSLSSNRADE